MFTRVQKRRSLLGLNASTNEKLNILTMLHGKASTVAQGKTEQAGRCTSKLRTHVQALGCRLPGLANLKYKKIWVYIPITLCRNNKHS